MVRRNDSKKPQIVVATLGLFVACLVLIGGNNIYQQWTGHYLYEDVRSWYLKSSLQSTPSLTVDHPTLSATQTSVSTTETDADYLPGDLPIPNIYQLTYDEARRIILEAGWQPQFHSWVYAQGVEVQSGNGPIWWERGYYEIEACSGTGYGFCKFVFRDAHYRTLTVVTGGEERADGSGKARVVNYFIDEPTAIPTPDRTETTPTVFIRRDLESYLLDERELPIGFKLGRVYKTTNMQVDSINQYTALARLTSATTYIYQSFSAGHSDQILGGVEVAIYQDLDRLITEYDYLNRTLGFYGVGTEIQLWDTIRYDIMGDNSTVAVVLPNSPNRKNQTTGMSELIFRRCQAIVHVSFDTLYELTPILEYGKKLDAKLEPFACP